MRREKKLVGYETVKGVIFAKYEKQIVEDDETITSDGLHRETITSESYDAIKKLDFVDKILLSNATDIHQLSVALLKTKDALTKESSEKLIALTSLDLHKELLDTANKMLKDKSDLLDNLNKNLQDELIKDK